MEHFAGVDTHRDTHSVAVLDSVGKVVDAFTIPANQAGYETAISRTTDFSGLIWGLEGTGSYGRPFADALLRHGATVYEVPGMISKRHRRRLRQRGKSDPHDAHAIAEAVLREWASLPQHLEVDAEEATRLLYERRDRKVRERTEKVNRIRALALRLELDLPNDMTSIRSLDIASSALDAYSVRGYADFEIVDEIRDLLLDIRRIQKLVADLEDRVRPFVERLGPELMELRGCSTVSAAGLIGHTGSILNYRNADAYAAHTGTAPIQCSSGKHTSVRVNNGGNRQLNRCLHNIANTQIRTEGHVGKIYYDRKRAEGKTHREAMRCLKRRVAVVVYRILKQASLQRELVFASKIAA